MKPVMSFRAELDDPLKNVPCVMCLVVASRFQDVTFLEHHVLETELFTVASCLVAKHFVVHVTWPGPTVLPLRFRRQSVSC